VNTAVKEEYIERVDDLTEQDLMRLSPVYFATKVSKSEWVPARHLKFIGRKVASAISGESPFICLSVPPRHGKSEFVSKWTVLWYLYNNPTKRVGIVSYSDAMATIFGDAVRKLVLEYGPQLGLELDPRKTAAGEWRLKTARDTFSCYSTGRGGSLTGRGFDLLVVDDPIKGSEEANSPTIRKNMWEWWVGDCRSRLEPKGSIIVIHTRWHEEDLIGKLTTAMENDPLADKYEIIKFPAIAEEDDALGRKPGEPLWKERYDIPQLIPLKANNAYNFSTVYQQNPAKREGSIFDSSNITFLAPQDLPKKFDRMVRHWDFAATENKKGLDPDWSVGLLLAEWKGFFYILDVVRDQWSPAQLEEKVKEVAARDTKLIPIHLEQEPGSSGKIAVDHYKREVLKGYRTSSDRTTGDKIFNAGLVASAIENGFMNAVIAPWNKDFKKEMDAFPFDKHDDQVDALSKAYNKLTSKKQVVVATPVEVQLTNIA
jgi:predicted phage terminase large subunit-like protein